MTNNKTILSKIGSPADIKALDEEQLPQLAQEVRNELISVLSQTGGHLGPNLGVVELTIALHRVFDTPKDKFVFDVSHQGYVHKLFTGRRERFSTIRQYEGLNGFLLRTESDHDCYGAGHAGTALSAALGMAAARDMMGGDEHVVCVAGDAAFTCGVSFEALNNVSTSTKKLIVVLNDNEWSIAKNVGAVAEYLNRIVANPAYAHLHEKGGAVRRMARRQDRTQARWQVRGGHEEPHRPERHLRRPRPPLLRPDRRTRRRPAHPHVRVSQDAERAGHPSHPHSEGQGLRPAIAKPDKFHGLGKFHHDTGETVASPTPTYSELLGKTLADFADHNNKIATITAAMPSGTGLINFAKRHPKRFFDVGIAEEHAALFASGLAVQGMKPFLAIYSTFMQRAYDMIVHDMALQKLNVALCMDRAGLSGDDGPTHHGLFDIGYLRHVPGLVQMQPKDEDEFADMLWTMANYHDGPIAIRYPRGAGTGVQPKAQPKLLEIGKSEVLVHGKQVALFGLGNMCEVALEAAELLKAQGISAAVINPRWIKPMDTATLEFFARGCEVVCTLEDHVLHNGFGCAVMEHLSDQRITTPVVRVGWPDEFIEHGNVPVLREKHGLTAKAAVEKILEALKPRQKSTIVSAA